MHSGIFLIRLDQSNHNLILSVQSLTQTSDKKLPMSCSREDPQRQFRVYRPASVRSGSWFSALQLTWVVSGHSCGTAKHLPAQRAVLPPVFNEDSLQGLSPVQLIEDDGRFWRKKTENRGRSIIQNASEFVLKMHLHLLHLKIKKIKNKHSLNFNI